MLFNSFEFTVFFPVVAGLYFAFPRRARWVLLLAASYYFYMRWEPAYAILILISTTADFTAGRLMTATRNVVVRRACLAGTLTVNLGLLFFFKYYNFLRDSLDRFFTTMGLEALPLPASHFLLPVGISFFTFQSLSYSFEVYMGRQETERNWARYALYVSFFPQLVAGPIERSTRLVPQLRDMADFDYARVTRGLRLMLWGLIEKMVIADRLAQFVDPIYTQPAAHDGPALTLATVFFAFQIYYDFAGYCDIAIGAAEVFGVTLTRNFDRPYFATSIRDFWRRWHISLSTWFRDYVYIPLGGNRGSTARWRFNILMVFALSGLWHGANWTFLAWGLLHGVYLILGALLEPWRSHMTEKCRLAQAPALLHALRIGTTFTLVCLAWVFFRADTLHNALYIIRHALCGWTDLIHCSTWANAHISINMTSEFFTREIIATGLALAAGIAVQIAQRNGAVRDWLARRPVWVRFAAYSLGLWCLFLFGIYRRKEFIYFTF